MSGRHLPGFVVTAVLGTCLAVASLDGPASAQSLDHLPAGLDAWFGAVRTHAPGALDAAATTVAPWSQKDLNDVLGGLSWFKLFLEGRAPAAFAAIFRRHDIVNQADMNRLLQLGAFFHADVAVLHRGSDGYALPYDNSPVRVLTDGRQVRVIGDTVHWAFARRLLDAMQPRPFRDDYNRLWYRATVAFFLFWNDYAQGTPHLDQARLLFPDDAVLMMYEGTLHEAYAEPRIQNAMMPLRFSQSVQPVVMAADEWRTAEERFRGALRADPRLSEARIRLGHVLDMRGRHEDAVTELEHALADGPPMIFEYYAQIFLGRAQQALGHFDAATRAFSRARTLYPGAQSPRLGLSELARDAGDRSAAIDALGPIVSTEVPVDRNEPYWVYRQTQVPDRDALFAELRRATVALRAAPLPAQRATGQAPMIGRPAPQ